MHFSSIKEITEHQNRELRKTLQYVSKNSAFYKTLFSENGTNISSIQSIDDLKKLPFTTKEDIQKNNENFICASTTEIIDYVTTSGVTGVPITLALTEKDLERLAYNECESFKIAGISKEDTIQLMTTLDHRFMAGLAYFLGARKLGAGIVRVGNGLPQLQWDTISRIKPTVIICVPSFILKLIDYAEKNKIDYSNSSVKKIICIGEPIRDSAFELNTLGKLIQEKWKVELISTYASSEMGAAFTECSAHRGGHLQPELIITEIVDDNNVPCKTGEVGELVVTTLGLEGVPLIRYKTGDVCFFMDEPCTCDRVTPRISPIIGRKNQMIKFKGTTLFPGAIFDVLNSIKDVENYVVRISKNNIGTDDLMVLTGSNNASEKLSTEIKQLLKSTLRVTPEVEIHEPSFIHKIQFPEGVRKAIKFIDDRK